MMLAFQRTRVVRRNPMARCFLINVLRRLSHLGSAPQTMRGISQALLACMFFFLLSNPAHAQDCLNNCVNQYEACLGGSWIGIGGIANCLQQLDDCEASCPGDPEPFPGPIGGSGGGLGDGLTGGLVGWTGNGCGGNVDAGTGLLTHINIDLSVRDVVPAKLIRTYREKDTTQRAFGLNMTNNYDLELYVDVGGQYTYRSGDAGWGSSSLHAGLKWDELLRCGVRGHIDARALLRRNDKVVERGKPERHTAAILDPLP